MRAPVLTVVAALAACDAPRPVTTCGRGTLRDGATCIANPACGNGTRIENGVCVYDPPEAVRCGFGTHRAGSMCVADSPVFTSSTSTTAWSPNVRVSEVSVEFATDPAMAVDSQGTIAIAAIVFSHVGTIGFTSAVAVWISGDAGASFSRAFTPDVPPSALLRDPTVLFDAEERLRVGWIEITVDESGHASGHVMVASASDGARGFSAARVDPDGDPMMPARPWLSLGSDRAVSVSYASTQSDPLRTASWRALAGDGAGFDTLEAITPDGFVLAPLAFAASGIGFAISPMLGGWRRTSGGWSSVRASPPSPFVAAAPRVIWSAKAGFVVAFVGAPEFATSLYMLRSVDDGRGFEGPFSIAGDGGARSSAALPSMTVDEEGRVHLMWLDNRGGGWTPFTSVSEDGIHFRSEERIGDAPFFDDGDPHRSIGSTNAIVARGGRRYAAWADSRADRRSQIFFSSAPGAR
jgi:hypothetical protein